MNSLDRVPLVFILILVAIAALAALMAPFVLAAAGAPGTDAWPGPQPPMEGGFPSFAHHGGWNAGW